MLERTLYQAQTRDTVNTTANKILGQALQGLLSLTDQSLSEMGRD